MSNDKHRHAYCSFIDMSVVGLWLVGRTIGGISNESQRRILFSHDDYFTGNCSFANSWMVII